jgi:predicted nucleic acid-binding protein
MKIFVDTNIFLDLVLGREKHQEALMLFDAIGQRKFEAYVLDITLINIDYVARKQVKDLSDFLLSINQYFRVIGATNDTIQKALDLRNSDLEESVQCISAIENHCEMIVTNDQDFPHHRIPLMTSDQVCQMYLGGY